MLFDHILQKLGTRPLQPFVQSLAIVITDPPSNPPCEHRQKQHNRLHPTCSVYGSKMAELKALIEKARASGRSFADMVYGPLPETPENGPKWKDLSPEDQADICKDFRESS